MCGGVGTVSSMTAEPLRDQVDVESFEQLYRAHPDPWSFATSPYEQHRYERTIANLPLERYHRCFEPGCSVGVLTARLAERADQVVAQDPSPAAVANARRRLADVDNVELRIGSVPEVWPDGTFDLIVCSELGYYFTRQALRALIERMHSSLEAGGDLIAVHWLGHSPDHLLHGSVVHEEITDVLSGRGAHRLIDEVDDGRFGERFVLNVWRRGS